MQMKKGRLIQAVTTHFLNLNF